MVAPLSIGAALNAIQIAEELIKDAR